MVLRSVFILVLLLTVQFLFAQIRNPFNEEILPFGKDIELIQEEGSFNHHKTTYGFVNHTKGKYALPFLTFVRDTTHAWLVVLNGGPGRSNIRLSFGIDSLLKKYNILLIGYRGVDDRALEGIINENDPKIQRFINKNRSKYSTEKIASDIALIAEKLQISSLNLIAHSYGTLVAGELYTQEPQLVDSIFAFSPVDASRPMPDPEKVKFFVASIFDSTTYEIDTFKDTLLNWLDDPSAESLAMGFVASMYNKKDFENMLKGVIRGDINRNDVIQRGEKYLKKRYIVDLALKINYINKPVFSSEYIYNQVTSIFHQQISRYLSSDSSHLGSQNPFRRAPVNFFIPKYEFFYTYSMAGQQLQKCECGHADLWKLAPKFVLEIHE